MEMKLCLTCGTAFEGRANRLYCSEKCKMVAFYNGNRENKTVYPADKPFLDETDNRLTDNLSKTVNQLIPITIMMHPNEKQSLEQQANYCGVELSKYILVRSQMNETDTALMQETIVKQKSEIDELKIRQSFFTNSHHQVQTKQNANEGLLIEMNAKQKAFLIEKWLESQDYDGSMGEWELSDGTITTNQKEIYDDFENETPGSNQDSIKCDILSAFFVQLEKDLIASKKYDTDDFQFESLQEQFDEIE